MLHPLSGIYPAYGDIRSQRADKVPSLNKIVDNLEQSPEKLKIYAYKKQLNLLDKKNFDRSEVELKALYEKHLREAILYYVDDSRMRERLLDIKQSYQIVCADLVQTPINNKTYHWLITGFALAVIIIVTSLLKSLL